MRLRMLATDVAGNTTIEDDIHADEIVVILNDVTAPGAFLQKMISSNCDFCRNLSDQTGVRERCGHLLRHGHDPDRR